MERVMESYKGLSLLVNINWDRIFTFGTVIVGLLAGTFLARSCSSPKRSRRCCTDPAPVRLTP